MVWGLASFQRAISVGGVRQFLDQEEARAFHEIEQWCREIGARRAAAYLAATAKLFQKVESPGTMIAGSSLPRSRSSFHRWTRRIHS
jgi:hypothetical protein